MITDVDEAPAFTTGAQAIDVPENSTDLFGAEADGYNQATVDLVTYTANGPGGTHRQLYADRTGRVQVPDRRQSSHPVLRVGPDFEAKASADGDNVYEVTVQASAGGDTGERMVRVTVGNVDEAPMVSAGLSVDGPDSPSVAENTTAVGTYMAAGPGADMATWEVMGDDMDAFSINSDGMLMFASAPDYENPTDMGGDNMYNVMVVAEAEGESSQPFAVTVEVTDADDPGMVTVMGESDSPLAGEDLTATLTDQDGGTANQMWTWQSSSDGTTWNAATGTATGNGTDSSTYTSVDADADMYVRATVSYNDDFDDAGKTAESSGVMVMPATVAGRYDANRDGVIDINEVITAIEAYQAGDLDINEVIEVIEAYQDGQN